MTLSSELLPAPFGPMMARISCSRTSKLMSVSALTPPNASEMLSSLRMTSPTEARTALTSVRSCLQARIHSRAMAIQPMVRMNSDLQHHGISLEHRRAARNRRGLGFCFGNAQIGGHHAAAPILEPHQRLDVLLGLARVERVDKHGILLADKAAPHLARAGQLIVVRIEFLVQDEEPMDLRIGERPFARKLRIHRLHTL